MTSRLHRLGRNWTVALGLASLALAAPICAADEVPPAAAEVAAPATAASSPVSLPKGRCPTMPVPAIRGYIPDGEHLANVRFLLKADGSLTQIRVEGRAPRAFLRAVEDAVTGYRCLPGETDLDIVSEFRLKIGSR